MCFKSFKMKKAGCVGVGCNSTTIVNRKYMLCQICNFRRLHPELSLKNRSGCRVGERAKEKFHKKVSLMKEALVVKNPLNTTGSKKRCKVGDCMQFVYAKGFCSKHYHHDLKMKKLLLPKKEKKKVVTNQALQEKKIKSNLSRLKREAKIKYVEESNGVCEGCRKIRGVLQYSHIISVGQRKDLELHPQNHNMLCQKCHEDWESYDPEKLSKLSVFYSNMRFIREHDTEKFWKIYYKFNDSMMFDVCKQIESIDEEFNKK